MLNLRKKLLVSIFTLMLALVAVSTTTYAWFTLGNEVTVSNLEMNVQGSEGLAIRIEKINGDVIAESDPLYKWELSKDLAGNEHIKVVLETLTMLALDGTQSQELTSVKFDAAGKAEYNTTPASTKPSSQVSPYLEITFGFRSEGAGRSVVFKSLKSDTNKTTHTFQSPVYIASAPGYTGGEVLANGWVTNARAAWAVRLAYVAGAPTTSVDWNIVDPAKYIGTNGYGDLFGTSVKYYEDVINVANPSSPISMQLPDDGEGNPAKYTYDNGEQALVALTTENTVNGIKYYEGSVTIRIWLEGWDSDCFNAVASDALKFAIEFELE